MGEHSQRRNPLAAGPRLVDRAQLLRRARLGALAPWHRGRLFGVLASRPPGRPLSADRRAVRLPADRAAVVRAFEAHPLLARLLRLDLFVARPVRGGRASSLPAEAGHPRHAFAGRRRRPHSRAELVARRGRPHRRLRHRLAARARRAARRGPHLQAAAGPVRALVPRRRPTVAGARRHGHRRRRHRPRRDPHPRPRDLARLGRRHPSFPRRRRRPRPVDLRRLARLVRARARTSGLAPDAPRPRRRPVHRRPLEGPAARTHGRAGRPRQPVRRPLRAALRPRRHRPADDHPHPRRQRRPRAARLRRLLRHLRPAVAGRGRLCRASAGEGTSPGLANAAPRRRAGRRCRSASFSWAAPGAAAARPPAPPRPRHSRRPSSRPFRASSTPCS